MPCGWWWGRRGERRSCQPRSSKHWPPEARRVKEGSDPASEGTGPCHTLISDSNSQHCRRTRFCCFKCQLVATAATGHRFNPEPLCPPGNCLELKKGAPWRGASSQLASIIPLKVETAAIAQGRREVSTNAVTRVCVHVKSCALRNSYSWLHAWEWSENNDDYRTGCPESQLRDAGSSAVLREPLVAACGI